jgi:hypothetical protein
VQRRRHLRMAEADARLRNQRLEAQPESGEFMLLRSVQREHGVVVDAGFLDVGQLRDEEAEVHDISPSVWLNAICGKPADREPGRAMRAAPDVYSLSSGKSKGERHMG